MFDNKLIGVLNKKRVLIIFLLAVIISVSGCYPVRNIPNGKYLLLKNNYKIEEGNIKQHSIPSYYKQKPNKKILFFRFYLNAYDLGTHFKDSSWVNRLLTENIGEPPVIFDSVLVAETGKNIKKHLNNLGYYNSSVYAKVKKWPKLKTASVTYIIKAKKPYRIRNINFKIPEKDVRSFVYADMYNSLLKKGELFDVATLRKERDRIVDGLNNAGFYYFMKNQITYVADTSLNSNEVDITLNIKPLLSKESVGDSLVYIKDRRYKIKDVYILYDISAKDLKEVKADTTDFDFVEDGKRHYLYHFIHTGNMNINPKALVNALFIKAGKFYKKNDVIESYKALTTLNTFKYINIDLYEIPTPDTSYGSLECVVSLIRSKKFSISSDSEVKNTGGDFGLEENIGFRSRNFFKNAEVFNINAHGAMEMQTVTNTPNDSKWPFNVYELGINASLEFPRFLIPYNIRRVSRYLRPKTRINLGYNFQNRPDYERYILNGSFKYSWHPVSKRYYGVKLLEVSSVKIYPSSEFQDEINGYTDPRIKYSYQDHLVLSTSASYNYNEMRFKGLRPFSYLFSSVEVGGLPWNFLARLNKASRDSLGQVTIFGLPSAEYIKLDNDGRYYLPSGKNFMNVFRANIGIGIPIGTSKALPFEKSFYIGGANSLRAWVIGTLGPGSYNSDATTFEVTGDIRMEFNYEFRFKISGSFEGALFLDAGNIWLLNESDARPGGQFKFSTFLPQLALDFGYGLRYDLSFLVLRLDFANPLYQPYLPKGSRWTALNPAGKLITGINFAIGYPF